MGCMAALDAERWLAEQVAEAGETPLPPSERLVEAG